MLLNNPFIDKYDLYDWFGSLEKGLCSMPLQTPEMSAATLHRIMNTSNNKFFQNRLISVCVGSSVAFTSKVLHYFQQGKMYYVLDFHI